MTTPAVLLHRPHVMPNAAKILVLSAAFLPIWAADPAASGSALPEPDATPSPLDGAELFATHCAMCHKPSELARRLQGAADPEAASADMAAFLAHHGRSDAAAAMAIIDHLAHSGSLMR